MKWLQERDQPAARELPHEQRVHFHVRVVELRVEQDHETERERGQHDEHEGPRDAGVGDPERAARAGPSREDHCGHGDGPVDRAPFAQDPLRGYDVPPAAGDRDAGEDGGVQRGGGRRCSGDPRGEEGEHDDDEQCQERWGAQRESSARGRALHLHPVQGHSEGPRVGRRGIDRQGEWRPAFQAREIEGHHPIGNARIGLDVERGDHALIRSDRNSCRLNKMAPHAEGQSQAFARDHDRQSDDGAARRPMELRSPIALPALTEAADVVDVVGAEVQDRWPRVAGRPRREEQRRRREKGEQGGVHAEAAPRATGRRRRAAGYVTRTAA